MGRNVSCLSLTYTHTNTQTAKLSQLSGANGVNESQKRMKTLDLYMERVLHATYTERPERATQAPEFPAQPRRAEQLTDNKLTQESRNKRRKKSLDVLPSSGRRDPPLVAPLHHPSLQPGYSISRSET